MRCEILPNFAYFLKKEYNLDVFVPVNIKSINTVKVDGKNSYAMKVSVLNLDVLNKYMNDLEQIKDVIAVERVIK